MTITRQSQVPEAPPGRHNAGSSLFLVVSEDGRNRRWVFRFTKPSTHKRTEMGLGSADVVTFADALAEALKQRKVVAEGKDPVEEKRKARRERTTFADVAVDYIGVKEEGWRSAKHAHTMRRLLENHAGALATKGLKAITIDDVEAALRPVWSRSPDQFKRTLSAISQVFDFAIAHNHRETNPADWRVMKHRFPNHRPKVKHYAAMDYAEVPEFVRQLHKEQQRDVALSPFVIEFLILTACRVSEVTNMRWDELNWAKRVWSIPAYRTKTQTAHQVPLSDRAIELLTRQKGTHFMPHVWLSRRPNTPISLKALYLYLTRTMKVPVTLHGFRSTFRDWAGNETSFDRVTCELALAHKAGDATELAYRRSDALEKRRALMEAWAKFLE